MKPAPQSTRCSGPRAAATPQTAVAPPRCAFTIDVEDWYQSTVDFDAEISERVLRNVERTLAVLNECGVKASFFVQGRVAEAFPTLLQELLAQGHEIQSHGYSHRPLFEMNHRQCRISRLSGRIYGLWRFWLTAGSQWIRPFFRCK